MEINSKNVRLSLCFIFFRQNHGQKIKERRARLRTLKEWKKFHFDIRA